MKTHMIKILTLILAFSLYVGAQDNSFDGLGDMSVESFYGEVSDSKAISAVPLVSAVVPVPIPTAAVDEVQAPAEIPEWLVMVFINARNNLWQAGIIDINEMETVGSTAKIAVTAELGLLQDKGNSTRFFIQKDNDNSRISSPGEKVMNSDMGSYKHL